MGRRKRRRNNRRRRRAPRIVAAVLLLLFALGVQLALFLQAAPIELPNDEEPGPIDARRGVEALVVDLPEGARWHSAPGGSRLTGADLDAGLLDDATRQLLSALPVPPPAGETSVSYRPEPPREMPSVDPTTGEPSAEPATARPPVECSTSLTWSADEPTRLTLTQDPSSTGCDIEWRADRDSRLRLVGVPDAIDRPACKRRLRLDAFVTGVRDPLSVEWTIPAESSIRLRFASQGDDSRCAPFDLASLRFERVATRAVDSTPSDRDDPRAHLELWDRRPEAPAFTAQALEIGASGISLAVRGEGWVIRRGKLQTLNRLVALAEFDPLARTLAIVVDLGLLGWIASLVLGKDREKG